MVPLGVSKQTTETLKKIMDGRVRLERRNANPMIYARAYLQGKDVVFRTNQTAPHLAQEVAENWYLEQLDRIKKGEQIHGRLFEDVADAFLKWVDEHRRGEISDGQIEQYAIKWKVLKPEFKDIKVTDVDGKFLVDLRDRRSKKVTQFKRTVTPATIQKDFVFIRLVLKHAKYVERCLTELPPFPAFQGPKFSIADNPTPYLTLRQYNTLTALAKAHRKGKGLNPRTLRQREELWCFILICVGAALRVGEAESIRWTDCSLVRLKNADKQEAVKMMVKGTHFKWTGKREEAFGLYQAVTAFKFLRSSRPNAKPDDLLFTENHREGIRLLLEKAKLRKTKDGPLRTAKSFRHTGISLWLQYAEQPNILDIAKWARTSVEQIQAFYDQNPRVRSVDRMAAFKKAPRKAEQAGKPERTLEELELEDDVMED